MNQHSMEPTRSDNGEFDPNAFRKALVGYLLLFSSPLILFGVLSVLLPVAALPGWVDTSGIGWLAGPGQNGIALGGVALGGLAVGVVAFGGWSIGILAVGGGAVGVIAIGGCSVGLVAIGGGAVGLVACGGGAAGYIALGGGAVGRYVLAGSGKGTFVLSYSRQDRQAAKFFCRWLKRLRKAFPSSVEALET